MCCVCIILYWLIGALVSAGFEVSATVVHDNHTDFIGQTTLALMDMPNNNTIDGTKQRNGIDNTSSCPSNNNKKSNDHILDSMVDWLTNVPEHEL